MNNSKGHYKRVSSNFINIQQHEQFMIYIVQLHLIQILLIHKFMNL